MSSLRRARAEVFFSKISDRSMAIVVVVAGIPERPDRATVRTQPLTPCSRPVSCRVPS